MTEFTKTFRRTTYPTISPCQPSNNQSGGTVLVTGGSEGIGFGIAQAFAEAQASKIILTSRSKAKLDDAGIALKQSHPDVDFDLRVSDASDSTQIQTLWSDLAKDNIFVDIFVPSASATLAPTNLEEQVSTINFNMIANLHSLDAFRNQPNPSKKPTCLISLNSAAVHCYPFHSVTYAATKAGLGDYLCHLADFVPESEMRIISYHPAAVYTSAAANSGEAAKDLPIWDDPILSAHMAVWLASKDAAFLHGRYVWANWDADELTEMKDRILADPAFLKVGVTGVKSFGVDKLMNICKKFPLPEGQR